LSNLDENLVGWDSQDDPVNPRNWPDRRKWFILGTLIDEAEIACATMVN
jgi:hypothetical protein